MPVYGAYRRVGVRPYSWRDDALCFGKPNSIWFPNTNQYDGELVARAKEICSECVVSQECLVYALGNDERYGVWGGLTPEERRRLQ